MRRFAECCEAIAGTTRKNEKVRLAASYLRSLPVEDAARAAVFLTGRPFPRHEEKVLAVGGAAIWQTVCRLSGIAPARMESIYRKHGDLGAMSEEALGGWAAGTSLTLGEVAGAFEEMAAIRFPAGKQAVVERLLSAADALTAKYIVKIITGDLRIGFKESLVEEAIALAFGQPADAVRRANMFTADAGETLRLAAAGRLGEAKLRLLQPVGFMLASAVESADEMIEAFPGGALVEDKYDGIRAQAHKRGEKVKLFSRTMDEIVEFHELPPALAALPGDFLMDGEVVGWRNGRPIPFTELQPRLGRKEPDLWLPLEIPVCFVAFDLLYADGVPLLDEPLVERRRRLAALLAGRESELVRLAPAQVLATAEEIERAFEEALDRGNEGIMAKAPASRYAPGRRGRLWLKRKQPLATLDVVVTAVEYGHGKRRSVLSDYTFAVRDGERLVNIGKAYSGLTDAEILRYTEYFLAHTVEDQGFRRTVEPAVVLEVAFNNIQRSQRHESGYALRFPRIVRLRPDKPVEEIDTVERVREIIEGQAGVKRRDSERPVRSPR
jgi:DNA ligase-1